MKSLRETKKPKKAQNELGSLKSLKRSAMFEEALLVKRSLNYLRKSKNLKKPENLKES